MQKSRYFTVKITLEIPVINLENLFLIYFLEKNHFN